MKFRCPDCNKKNSQKQINKKGLCKKCGYKFSWIDFIEFNEMEFLNNKTDVE